MNDEVNTPEHVVRSARKLMRMEIGLDPCSNTSSVVGAVRSYQLPDKDGLLLPWRVGPGEFAFVNPPYSRGQIPKWIRKALYEWEENHTPFCLLLPTDTSTAWFHDLVLRGGVQRAYIRGRIKWPGYKNSPKFGSMFVYMK